MKVRCRKCGSEKELDKMGEEIARMLISSGSSPKCSEPDDFTKSGRCQGEMFEVLDGAPIKVTKIHP